MPAATHPRLRVAAVQAAPVFADIDATIDKTIALMEQAAADGVQLIAFPETWIPGYPWWIWLTPPALGMAWVQRYFDNSLVIGGAEFQRLRDAARRLKLWLALGFSERAAGSLYIAQALIDDQGLLRRSRRKLKPTHVERTVFGDGDGSDLTVTATALGNIGMLNCWEHLQPLSKYALYAQDEQIHIGAWPSFSIYPGAAHALGPEVNTAASRVYAAEGQCFVIAPCAVVSPAMHAALCTEPLQQQLLQPGGGHARIYGPDGAELATPLAPDAEGLLIADIDLGVIALAKHAADPVGHYARPDVTRLLLNRSPGHRVMNAVEAGSPFEVISGRGAECPPPPAGDDADSPGAGR
ncbi:MAG: carbon-nitrogen hydrolase family protein [Gammaproteobacteria bacterium]|nr:carbon-nitrogen hydrolase family protein [Gammaproteobacteria bacterium]